MQWYELPGGAGALGPQAFGIAAVKSPPRLLMLLKKDQELVSLRMVWHRAAQQAVAALCLAAVCWRMREKGFSCGDNGDQCDHVCLANSVTQRGMVHEDTRPDRLIYQALPVAHLHTIRDPP